MKIPAFFFKVVNWNAFMLAEKHCKTLQAGTFWRSQRRFLLQRCRWTYFAVKKSKLYPRDIERKLFKILVTVLLVSFKQPSNNTVLWLLIPVSNTLFFYITMGRLTDADFEKQRDLVKSRFLHLNSGNSIINLKLEPFGEVCGGCPQQLRRR